MSLLVLTSCSRIPSKKEVQVWWGNAGDKATWEEAWEHIGSQTEWVVMRKSLYRNK